MRFKNYFKTKILISSFHRRKYLIQEQRNHPNSLLIICCITWPKTNIISFLRKNIGYRSHKLCLNLLKWEEEVFKISNRIFLKSLKQIRREIKEQVFHSMGQVDQNLIRDLNKNTKTLLSLVNLNLRVEIRVFSKFHQKQNKKWINKHFLIMLIIIRWLI